MALTKTARLELINPYAKYGLKRRPTFTEILGLVSENDKALRPFPNREATRFRNSPQGSFFDGSDNLDLLKEQQTRILDRQMRETMLRRQAQQNGGTFHLMQHQQNSGTTTPITSNGGFETPSSVNEALRQQDFLDELNQRYLQEQHRAQEARREHEASLERLNDSLFSRMIMRRGQLPTSQEDDDELPPLEPLPGYEREFSPLTNIPANVRAQASSSSSGQGQSFSASVKEGAKAGAKQVAKAAAVKGGEILIKKAFGIP